MTKRILLMVVTTVLLVACGVFAGGDETSTEDLYDQALYTNVLVSQESLAEAFTSGVLNNGEETAYGFGFELGEYAGETYIGHSGAWLGFESYYLRFPTRNLSVVVLLNLDYSDEGAEGLAFSTADLYLK